MYNSSNHIFSNVKSVNICAYRKDREGIENLIYALEKNMFDKQQTISILKAIASDMRQSEKEAQ